MVEQSNKIRFATKIILVYSCNFLNLNLLSIRSLQTKNPKPPTKIKMLIVKITVGSNAKLEILKNGASPTCAKTSNPALKKAEIEVNTE